MTTNPQRLLTEKLLLENMAQVLSVDHFRRMKIMFNEMSDYDFGQLIRELQASAPDSFTLKEFACTHKEAIIGSKVRPSANALSEVPIEFLPEEENKKLLARIYASHPSDTIRLNGEGDRKLISLWEDGMKHEKDMADRAWHAGASSLLGRRACNDFSIGIELVGDEHHRFTERQYARLASTVATLRRRYRLRFAVGHADIAPGRKIDPGPFFDWNRVLAMPAFAGLERPPPDATGVMDSRNARSSTRI